MDMVRQVETQYCPTICKWQPSECGERCTEDSHAAPSMLNGCCGVVLRSVCRPIDTYRVASSWPSPRKDVQTRLGIYFSSLPELLVDCTCCHDVHTVSRRIRWLDQDRAHRPISHAPKDPIPRSLCGRCKSWASDGVGLEHRDSCELRW